VGSAETPPEPSRRDDAVAIPEALAKALRKIGVLVRNGRPEEAYAEYAELFASASFADTRPDEQRHALRAMLLVRDPPPRTAAVVAAHRSAVDRLGALVAATKDPRDHELLGIAHLVLDDPAAARAAFRAGLDIEVDRDSTSELSASLKRWLGAL
jgi:hypothetical protein